jgi:hypothetical protein
MLATLIGLLIATTIGLTGIGGGVLTTPVLLLFLGMPAPQAVGTALVFVAVVKLFAAPMFLARKQVNFRILGLLLLGGLPGAILGSLLLDGLKVKRLDGLMLLLLGTTIVISASATFLRKATGQQGKDKAMRLPFFSFPIGLEVGFSSAGAGALGSLALMHWTTLASSQIVGTDILFGLGLSSVAGSMHFASGGVDSTVLRYLLAGGIPGSLFGAWLATKFPTQLLRKGLAIWLMGLGAILCYRGFNGIM